MHYRILPCLLLFIYLSTKLFGQTKIFEYKLSPEELTHVFSRTTYQGKDSILISLIYHSGVTKILLKQDSVEKLVQQEKTSTPLDKNFLLKTDQENFSLIDAGSCVYGSFVTECNFSDGQQKIYLTTTDFSNGISKTTDTITFREDESFITSLSEDSTLYIFTYINHSNQINVYKKAGQQPVKGYEKTIQPDHPMGAWETTDDHLLTVKKISDLFSHSEDKGFILMEEDKQYPAILSRKKIKLYHLPGRFVISLDNTNLQTIIIDIKLSNLSHTLSVTELPKMVTEDSKKKSGYNNSYLTSDILFRSGNYNGNFFMLGMNTANGQILFSSFIKKKQLDSAFNSDFFKTASFNFPSKEKYKRVARFLDNPNSGAIYNKINDSLANIEFCYPMVKMPWLNIVLSVAFSVTGTYLINSIPNTVGFSLIIFDSDKENLANAQNTFNIKTGAFKSEPATTNPYQEKEKKLKTIQEFFKKSHFDISNLTYRTIGDEMYVSFLYVNQKKFCVYKF